MELSADDSTTKLALALKEPVFAVMVTTPGDCPIAAPVLLIVATVGSEEDQFTEPLMDCLLPSLNVPIAVNCCPEAGAASADEGVTAMETSVAPLTVVCDEPVVEAPA
jgi:hypothetical protein